MPLSSCFEDSVVVIRSVACLVFVQCFPGFLPRRCFLGEAYIVCHTYPQNEVSDTGTVLLWCTFGAVMVTTLCYHGNLLLSGNSLAMSRESALGTAGARQ